MSLATIRTKIRYNIDTEKSTSKTFTYENSNEFTLPKSNVNSITKIEVGGSAISSSKYSLDSDISTVTIDSGELTSGDSVVIYYKYYDYSNTELNRYIINALVELSINRYSRNHQFLRVDDVDTPTVIYPTPNEGEENLIAFIVGVLIRPEYSYYNLPTVTVRYPREEDRDTKIRKIIQRYKISAGISVIIDLSNGE